MTDGYESWWNVGIATTSSKESCKKGMRWCSGRKKKQEITKICKDRFRRRKTVSKVFGYPKFDEYGEMILTTYDNDYKAMMMDIRVYSMKAG